MTKFKVTVDKPVCIGCGTCSSCSNFNLIEINGEYKSVVQQEIIDSDVEANKEAEANCPVDCIKVVPTE